MPHPENPNPAATSPARGILHHIYEGRSIAELFETYPRLNERDVARAAGEGLRALEHTNHKNDTDRAILYLLYEGRTFDEIFRLHAHLTILDIKHAAAEGLRAIEELGRRSP